MRPTPTSAAVAIMCLVAAAARGIAASISRAMARISVALASINSISSAAFAACRRAASSKIVVMSASFFPRVVDQLGEAVQLFIRHRALLPFDQRGHDVGGRAVEKRRQKLVERRKTHAVTVHSREVYVASAIMLMLQMTFLLEDPQCSPNS